MVEEKPMEAAEQKPEEELSQIDQADLSKEEGLREYPEETLCPSCGRFVGAYEKCPYCGAELKKRMSLVMWKKISVFGTLLGLAIMWFAATQMDPTEIQIGEIGETYNNAQVTIQGIVVNRRTDELQGSISLDIADKSGTIQARSFSALPKFKELGNIPAVGDLISTVGTIGVDAVYGTSLNLSLPHRLKILESPEPEDVKISKITHSWVNSKVTVKGLVKFPNRFGKATITDGVTDLILLLDERNLGEDIPEFAAGDGIEITGVILGRHGEYKIIPCSAEDLKPAEVSIGIEKMKIKDITMADLGELVEVEGRVVRFKAFPNGGGSCTITDGTGRINISPLFASIFDKIPDSHKLKISGTRIKAEGTVGEFRGDLQVRPGGAENVTILPPEKKK
ncbi:MAG: hypothetical protein U9N73_00125 [Candidatus Auribacterota bacterium]|nr:hypothetical protein [Candidatus Auribacterota bacterium]